jgi:hypothetical protein
VPIFRAAASAWKEWSASATCALLPQPPSGTDGVDLVRRAAAEHVIVGVLDEGEVQLLALQPSLPLLNEVAAGIGLGVGVIRAHEKR